jgi:flagellar motor component MotA
MKPITEKSGIMIPHLGIVGASFAAFLTILTLNPRPALAVEAVEYFSFGIPISLAPLFFLPIEKYRGIYKNIFELLNAIFIYSGIIGCLIGLHKCFKLVSQKAAETFSIAIISLFVGILCWYIIDEIVFTRIKAKGNRGRNT